MNERRIRRPKPAMPHRSSRCGPIPVAIIAIIASALIASCTAAPQQSPAGAQTPEPTLEDALLTPVPPFPAGSVTDEVPALTIWAGDRNTCAITTDGVLRCWGANDYGQLGIGSSGGSGAPIDVPGLSSGVTAVSGGFAHICALTSSGGVKCWGSNLRGALGNAEALGEGPPVDVFGLTSGVTKIAVGGEHTCALTSAGGVKCWGKDDSGQLGNGKIGTLRNGLSEDSKMPVDVVGLATGVMAIASGAAHTCALMNGGSVKCWGNNGAGALGNGTTTDSATPLAVIGLPSRVTAISAGGGYTCALTDRGGVTCWGVNRSGELGNGTTTDSSTPVDVLGLASGVIAVSAGGGHACALLSDGRARCWGDNGLGQLGFETPAATSTPVVMTALYGLTAISAGGSHTCSLTRGGGVWCWGWNSSGQAGPGDVGGWLSPRAVPGFSVPIAAAAGPAPTVTPVPVTPTAPPGSNSARAIAIAAGGYETCALTNVGGVKCWGYNATGQLGNGTRTGSTAPGSTTPVDVVGLASGVAAISVGYNHSCALTTSGGVKCWGANTQGQLGDGTLTESAAPDDDAGLTSGVIAISAGNETSCAITSVGGVVCWGRTSGVARALPIAEPGLASGVVAIIPGCALTAAGGLKCWLSDVAPASGGMPPHTPTPVDIAGLMSGVRAVAGSGGDVCVITTQGGVKCRGYNRVGQLGPATTIQSEIPVDVSGLPSDITGITSGGEFYCALSSQGGVRCWGADFNGQLGNGAAGGSSPVPLDARGLTSGVASVAAGLTHACALLRAGGVMCWGENYLGELGIGTTTDSAVPMVVPGL